MLLTIGATSVDLFFRLLRLLLASHEIRRHHLHASHHGVDLSVWVHSLHHGLPLEVASHRREHLWLPHERRLPVACHRESPRTTAHAVHLSELKWQLVLLLIHVTILAGLLRVALLGHCAIHGIHGYLGEAHHAGVLLVVQERDLGVGNSTQELEHGHVAAIGKLADVLLHCQVGCF